MSIATAAVTFRGKDETASALRSIVRNTESAQKQISTKLRAAFNFVGIGTAFYGIQRAVMSAVRAGDDLAKFAQKSGLAAEAASELAHAAKMADIDLGALETGVKKMQVTLSQAGSGAKAPIAALKALGLAFQDLEGLEPDKQFEIIAEQISRLKDPADRTRAAVELFGRAGADLLPMFEQGAAGIRAARLEAQQLGQSFSAEDLERFQQADTAFKQLAASSKGLAAELTLGLAPALANAADAARDLLKGDIDWGRIGKILSGGPIGGVITAGQMLFDKEEQQSAPWNPSRRSPYQDTPDFKLPPGFEPEMKKAKELSKAAADELERFNNQATTIANDAAGAFNSIAGAVGSPLENEAAIGRAMADIREDGVAATNRVIDLGVAFEEADKKAATLMQTINDEAIREGFTAVRDLLYQAVTGAGDLGDALLDAFIRVASNWATQRLFGLLAGLAEGGTGGGTGFWGTVLNGIASAFGGGKSGGGSSGGSMDSGGRGVPGRSYLIGTGAQPERFTPDVPGRFTPADDQGGGGINVTMINSPHVVVQGGADMERRVMGAIEQSGENVRKRAVAEVITGLKRNRWDLRG